MNEYKSLLEVENEFEDSNLDRVIPNESDFTSQERHLPLSEVYKTYTYRQELVNQILKDPEPSIGTKIGAGLKRGGDMVVDFLPQMRELLRRSLNGHTMPNMTEKQAEDLLAAGTRSLMADKQARAIVEQYKGVDDSFITDVFGAASSAGILLIFGVLAGLTGGSSVVPVATGVIGGGLSAGQASQEYAEDYYVKNYGMRGYKGGVDSIWAATHGAISGYIESKLGVDNLIKNVFSKTGIKELKKGALKNIGMAALGEAGEEILQETSGSLFGSIVGSEDRTFGEFLQDSLTNAAYGALVGGVFGSGTYYTARTKLIKQFKKSGYSDEEARNLADTAIDDIKEALLKEIATSTSLRANVGEAFDTLVDKIETALNAADFQDTHTGLSVHEYAVVNASDTASQVIRQARSANVPTSDILDLAQIEVVDNAIWLKPQELGTAQDINKRVKDLDKQIRDINSQLRVQSDLRQQLREDKNLTNTLKSRKAGLKRQRDLLKRLYDSKVGIEQEQKEKLTLSKQRCMKKVNPTADVNSFDTVVRKQAYDDVKLLSEDIMALSSNLERQKNAVIAYLAGDDTQLFDNMVLSGKQNIQRGVNSAIESINELMSDPELLNEYRGALKLASDMTLKSQFEEIVADNATFGSSAILHELVHKGSATGLIQSYTAKKQANKDGNNRLGKKGIFNDDDLYYQALKEQNPDLFDGDHCTSKSLTAVLMSRMNQFDNTGKVFNQADITTVNGQVELTNGYYDAELKVIVLGRNMNTMTLPHEMAHFWLDNTFSMFKKASKGELTIGQQWIDETNTLFGILGIDPQQETLTRSQQETFATITEAVITGLAPVPDGATLPMTEYLNWIPEKYKSIAQIGFRNENGMIVHPVLDQAAVDFFNVWYGNMTLPPIPSSPARDSMTNPRDENGEIIPSTTETMQEREKTIKKAIKDQESADESAQDQANQSSAEQAETAGALAVYDSAEQEKPTLPKHESWLKAGRGTNTREQLAKAARNYVKKNPDHAREVSQGNPFTTENDTGVDRESLILAVMEMDNITYGTELGILYEHNIALSRSRAGTELGTHSRTGSYQMYLDAYKRIEAAMTEKAAYKYAGRGAGAVDKFNSDIDALIIKWADKVFSQGMDIGVALRGMMAEASVQFTGEEGVLHQLDLTQAGKTRQVFIAYANRLIKQDIAKAQPNAELQRKLLEMAPKAEKAAIDLNSSDITVAKNAALALRDWSNLVRSEDVSQSMLGKAINTWAPRAMLSGVSTHVTNIVSNSIEQTMVRGAIASHYGENIVRQSELDNETARIKTVYNESGMNLTTMITSSDPSLVHGEKYKPLDPKAKTKAIDPLQWLSAEDNLFRIPTYIDVLSRMASRDANGDVNKAKELFRQYASTQPKKINGQDNTLYKKRQEAILVASMATFTQNGKLAGALNKMRDALNQISFEGRSLQLGTMIAPFVKTPANIIESGLRAPYGALKTAYKKLTGGEITIEDAVDTAHFIGFALVGTIAAAFCDYEPPCKGGKYDPNKPYDSIEIAQGVWVKIDTLGVIESPLRLLLSMRDGATGAGIKQTISATPLIGELTDGNLNYALNDPLNYAGGLAYNQIGKLTPTIARQTTKPIIRETGLSIDANTNLGRKFARRWGLDESENTVNDFIGLLFNRIKITE